MLKFHGHKLATTNLCQFYLSFFLIFWPCYISLNWKFCRFNVHKLETWTYLLIRNGILVSFKKDIAKTNIFKCCQYITNFMGHKLAIIVMWNMFFSYGIDMNVIHLLVLIEHQYDANYLNTNFILCLFVLFGHKCWIFILVVYTWKSCTQLLCLGVNKITQATFTCFLTTFVTTFWKIFLEYFGIYSWKNLQNCFFFILKVFVQNLAKNVIFKKIQIQYPN